MSAAEAVETVEPDVDTDRELLHIHCCDDPDLALCGWDVTGERFASKGDAPECETCARLEDADQAACTVRRSPTCPLNVLGGAP